MTTYDWQPRPTSVPVFHGLEHTPTEPAAVLTFVLGLVSVFFPILPGLVAVVLGVSARRACRETESRGAGLALAGQIIAAVFLVINSALLIALFATAS